MQQLQVRLLTTVCQSDLSLVDVVALESLFVHRSFAAIQNLTVLTSPARGEKWETPGKRIATTAGETCENCLVFDICPV